MRKRCVGLMILALGSCKTTGSMHAGLSAEEGGGVPSHLPAPVHKLWDDYVARETGGASIQPDCMPRIIEADEKATPRGTVMFFHGFTACPQQYFDIGQKLSQMGFDVFLPLLPGEGRTFKANPGPGEYYRALPAEEEGLRLADFVSYMNEIIEGTMRPHVLTGLSGGADFAVGAVVTGGSWDRLLLYAPYFSNPPVSGALSSMIATFKPDYVNDWGDECRANSNRPGGRAGVCALEVTAIRAMTNYGSAIAKDAYRIEIPVQFVGVEHDPTAYDLVTIRTQQTVKHSQLCLYPKGVPHSMINPKADAPNLDPYWVPALQQDSINFIADGTFFPTDPTPGWNYAVCRTKL